MPGHCRDILGHLLLFLAVRNITELLPAELASLRDAIARTVSRSRSHASSIVLPVLNCLLQVKDECEPPRGLPEATLLKDRHVPHRLSAMEGIGVGCRPLMAGLAA
jgi:hypothetical protein